MRAERQRPLAVERLAERVHHAAEPAIRWPHRAVGRNQNRLAAKPHTFELWLVLWQIGRYGLALTLCFGVVSVIYHFGPNIKQKWRLLTPGSVFTVMVWLGLGVLFRLYVDKFGKYGETYGAVGGVIILLFFFYLDALVLLVGAEINSEIDACAREMTGKSEPETEELLKAAGVKPPPPAPLPPGEAG